MKPTQATVGYSLAVRIAPDDGGETVGVDLWLCGGRISLRKHRSISNDVAFSLLRAAVDAMADTVEDIERRPPDGQGRGDA